MDKTSNEIRTLIRKAAGLQDTKNEHFRRSEIKKIASILNPAAKLISDDPNHRDYCNNDNIFPNYLSHIWVKQTTVATHPIKSNLVRIYKQLIAATSKYTQPVLPFDKVEIETTTEMSNIADIFNSLPETFRNRAKSIEIKSNSLTISIDLSN